MNDFCLVEAENFAYPFFMRYPQPLIKRAKELRLKGMTYGEIRKILGIKIPKGTLSNWCSDIPLPSSYNLKVSKLNQKNLKHAQRLAKIVNHKRRQKFLQNLREQNEYLEQKLGDRDILKMLLSILYITEGSKWRSHRGLSFGNSDPDLVQLYLYLLRLCYNLNPKSLKASICYRADQSLRSLQCYWSRITAIPLKNFYPSKPDPRTQGKKTFRKNYKGVCKIFGGGTKIQLELEIIPSIILRGVST